jgi:pimeloyl-ACP methyl ester carboxylesterase
MQIRLDFEAFGNPADPALLLIMGLATQRTAWPQSWIDAFVTRGFYVITFDNRDVGLSERLDHLGMPNFAKIVSKRLIGIGANPPYTIKDMAQDALDLLDQLKIQRAFVFGISMGGMIAQRLALLDPERVLGLMLLMSSSGKFGLPLPHKSVRQLFATRPKAGLSAREAAVDYLIRFFTIVGSPAYPVPEAERQTRAWVQVNRSVAGQGANRHIAAILADGQRYRELANIRMPTMVLHGDSDKLLPYKHGLDLAKRIPTANFELLRGVGHDVPDQLSGLLADRLEVLRRPIT